MIPSKLDLKYIVLTMLVHNGVTGIMVGSEQNTTVSAVVF